MPAKAARRSLGEGGPSCLRTSCGWQARCRYFHNRRDSLPPADTRGGQAARQAPAAELEDERQQQPCPGHAERVAERDGAAVHVDPLPIEAELFLDRQVLRRERFVDLDEIDVLQGEPGPMPINAGSTPTVAQCVSRASGVRP